MLKKLRITSIAAAMLLASPAFAGKSFAQPAQHEGSDGQRIISEAVISGRLLEEGSGDEVVANELRPVPSWVDHSSALDRRPQPSW
jgi:hypothetical protein